MTGISSPWNFSTGTPSLAGQYDALIQVIDRRYGYGGNESVFEDLDAASFERVLNDLRAGKEVKPGPQNERHASEPIGGLTSLTTAGQPETGGSN